MTDTSRRARQRLWRAHAKSARRGVAPRGRVVCARAAPPRAAASCAACCRPAAAAARCSAPRRSTGAAPSALRVPAPRRDARGVTQRRRVCVTHPCASPPCRPRLRRARAARAPPSSAALRCGTRAAARRGAWRAAAVGDGGAEAEAPRQQRGALAKVSMRHHHSRERCLRPDGAITAAMKRSIKPLARLIRAAATRCVRRVCRGAARGKHASDGRPLSFPSRRRPPRSSPPTGVAVRVRDAQRARAPSRRARRRRQRAR
jgi:hypothetical protein